MFSRKAEQTLDQSIAILDSPWKAVWGSAHVLTPEITHIYAVVVRGYRIVHSLLCTRLGAHKCSLFEAGVLECLHVELNRSNR